MTSDSNVSCSKAETPVTLVSSLLLFKLHGFCPCCSQRLQYGLALDTPAFIIYISVFSVHNLFSC